MPIFTARTTRTAAPVALAAVLVFSLSGCFANPLDGLVNGLVEGGVENIIEDQTGVNIDVNGDGSGASLPADWPADVPTPSGTIVSSMAMDGTFIVAVQVADEAAAQAGLDALLSAGFETESELDMGAIKIYGVFKGTQAVSYSWTVDEESKEVFVNMTITQREA